MADPKTCKCDTCEIWRDSGLQIWRATFTYDDLEDGAQFSFLSLNKSIKDFKKALKKAEKKAKKKKRTSNKALKKFKKVLEEEGFSDTFDFENGWADIEQKLPKLKGVWFKRGFVL